MTPIRNPSGVSEDRYNVAHIRTRNTIERAFGLLKVRFRCLHVTGGALMYKPTKVCKLAVMCMMLHNLARRRNVPMPEEPETTTRHADGLTDSYADDDDQAEALEARQTVVRNHF